jgi:hypothetical protein
LDVIELLRDLSFEKMCPSNRILLLREALHLPRELHTQVRRGIERQGLELDSISAKQITGHPKSNVGMGMALIKPCLQRCNALLKLLGPFWTETEVEV